MRRTLLLLCGLLLGCSTVPTAPDSVAVQLVMRAPGSDVYVGEGLALDATALDQYGDSTATDPIEWSVDVPTLARVSPRGTLTGLAPGVVTVTARSGPIATHRSVTVHSSDPVQMWLSIPQTGLPLGGTAQLGTEVMAELGHLLVNPSVTWSVSPSGVVTVDGKGLVTAIGMGTAAVTATAGRISRSVTFQVPLAYPVSMSFAVVKSILGLGDTVMIAPRVISNRGQEMTGTQITWSSDQPEIATVSARGVVRGVAQGSVTIRGSVGSVTASTVIEVAVPVKLLLFSESLLMLPGAHFNLGPVVVTSAGSTFAATGTSWRSSHPEVATVSSTGVVTAIQPGTTDVTGTLGSMSATARVTVLPLGSTDSGAIPPNGGAGAMGGLSFVRRIGTTDRIEVYTAAGDIAPGLTPAPLILASYPRSVTLSPDGLTLAYDCSGGGLHICWFRRDDGTTGTLPISAVFAPAWMPDADQIAMVSAYSALGVYDLRADGIEIRPTPFYASRPIPSPDGNILMYQCDFYKQYDDPQQLCQMNRAGIVTLYQDPAVGFSWASDGRASYLRLTNGDGSRRSLVIDNFPSGAGAAQEFPGFDNATETAWSPDRSRIAVVRNGELWIYDLPGLSNPRRIAYIAGTTISSLTWR